MAFLPDRSYAPATVSAGEVDQGLRSYMLRVYNWMSSGLALTGIVAYAIYSTNLRGLFWATDYSRGYAIPQPTMLGLAAIFAPLAFVLVLSFGINRLSRTASQALFWLFSAAMGASLSSIFIKYQMGSIAQVFFITAGTFAAMSAWGYATRRDLTAMGSFLMMGLIGIILASVVNMFIGSAMTQFVISILGVLIFTGLTAYDTQRIKADYMEYSYAAGTDVAAKRSVMDALTLYLNFINLFTLLLQLFGGRNSNN